MLCGQATSSQTSTAAQDNSGNLFDRLGHINDIAQKIGDVYGYAKDIYSVGKATINYLSSWL